MAMINYTQAVIPQTLPAGDFEAYTVPTKTVTQVRAATFFNKSASPITLKVSVVPSGATLGADYSLKELPINLDGTVTYNGKRWTFDKKQSF
ncbi:hypothetical protein [Acinetobacter baumannii]